MFFIVVLSTLIASSVAQLPIIGGCPPVDPIGVFDMSKMLGAWYEIAKVPNLYELNHKCSTITSNKLANDSITMSLDSVDSLSGAIIEWDGLASPIDDRSTTQFEVSFPSLPEPRDTVFTVLDTDYTNYAVVYYCQDIGIEGLQYVWIMSRTRKLDPKSKATVRRVLFKNDIPKIALVNVDQTQCPTNLK